MKYAHAKTSSRRQGRTPNATLALRLAPELIREIKIEAATRGLRLNELFQEMWELYNRRARK